VLTQNECREITDAVEGMLLTPYYKAKRSDHEIPPDFWPPTIRKLHPVAVYTHSVNVFIAVSRNTKEERGYCVMPGFSSNFPTREQEGWTWKPIGDRGYVPHVWMYRRDLIKNKLGASEKIFKDSPEFRAVEGKYFVLIKECYVFRYIGENNKYPFVGFVSGTEIGIPGFPNDAKDFVGKQVNDVEILGVLPQGTEFTVVQWRRVSKDGASLTRFDISPVGSLQKKWGILDGFWLTDEHTEKVPFYSEIVRESERAIH
jgi:hypothetical protein